jgi:hypothetical protein
MILEVVTRPKNKVVIWRPFPSPTKRETVLPSVLSLSGLVKPQKEDSNATKDEAAVNRWVELADILNGNTKPNRRRRAA